MTRRATEVTRWVLRGDPGTAEKYKPRGRVLLARAIAKLNSDARKFGIEQETLENDTVTIIARADYAGNVVVIIAGAGTNQGCCTYTDELQPDPNLGEDQEGTDDSSVEDAFGDGTWNGRKCGESITEVPEDCGYYTNQVLAQVNFTASAKESDSRNPCSSSISPCGYWSGLIALEYCAYVWRDWDLDETYQTGGNCGTALLGTCKGGEPIYLRWSVDVTEKYKFYWWQQNLTNYGGIFTGSTFATSTKGTSAGCPDNNIHSEDCINFFLPKSKTNWKYDRWWQIRKTYKYRKAELVIDVVVGNQVTNLVNMSVYRNYFFEKVATYLDTYDGTYDPNIDIGCPPNVSEYQNIRPIPGDAMKNEFTRTKDVVTYIPENTGIVTKCEDVGEEGEYGDEETDEETTEEKVYKQTSGNGCVRCVVYRGDTLVCTGPWIDPVSGGICTNPGTEPVAPEPEEEVEEEIPEEEAEDEDVELPDVPEEENDPDSIIDQPIDEVAIHEQFDFAAGFAGNGSDPEGSSSGYAGKEEMDGTIGRLEGDFLEQRIDGPDPGVYKGWVTELARRPVSAFETWEPPSLVSISTGGKTCKNS